MTHLKKLAALLLFAAITLNIGCGDDKKRQRNESATATTTNGQTSRISWKYHRNENFKQGHRLFA
jgi:uncharacterized lipoprotein YehR (DUF1307 family)